MLWLLVSSTWYIFDIFMEAAYRRYFFPVTTASFVFLLFLLLFFSNTSRVVGWFKQLFEQILTYLTQRFKFSSPKRLKDSSKLDQTYVECSQTIIFKQETCTSPCDVTWFMSTYKRVSSIKTPGRSVSPHPAKHDFTSAKAPFEFIRNVIFLFWDGANSSDDQQIQSRSLLLSGSTDMLPTLWEAHTPCIRHRDITCLRVDICIYK